MISNFPKNERTYVCVSGGKNVRFFGKFGVLCFLEIRVLRFALLPCYQRSQTFQVDHIHYHVFLAQEARSLIWKNICGFQRNS